MGQSGVVHNADNSRALQAFGADAPRGILHDLLARFDFVFGPITHACIGCRESSQDATRPHDRRIQKT